MSNLYHLVTGAQMCFAEVLVNVSSWRNKPEEIEMWRDDNDTFADGLFLGSEKKLVIGARIFFLEAFDNCIIME